MNTRDWPAPPDAAHACPAHHSRSPTLQRGRTAVHTRRESRTGHPQGKRRYDGPGITSSRRRTRRGASNQRLRNRPSTTTTPSEPTLPKRTPSYNPTKRDRATHSTNAGGRARRRERRGPAQRMQRTTNECRLALAAHDVEHEQRPNEFLPHPPGGGHAPRTPATRPRQRKGRGPTRTCPST